MMKVIPISATFRNTATMLLGVLAWEGIDLVDASKKAADTLRGDIRVTRKYDLDRNGLDYRESRALIYGEYDKDQNGIIDIQEGHTVIDAMGQIKRAVNLKNEISPPYQAGQIRVLEALEQINQEQKNRLSN